MEPQLRTAAPASPRYLCGTQPITSLAMVECGLDTFAEPTDMQPACAPNPWRSTVAVHRTWLKRRRARASTAWR
jgi:hypothetical protein